MDKTKIGLVGTITSLAAAGAMGAQAAPTDTQPVLRAQSYAELLDPIPNAVERLALVNNEAEPDGARLIETDNIVGAILGHHHHHHHRRHWRRRHYHHHHHHHNN